MPEFVALFAALTLYAAAPIAEVVRAAFEGVGRNLIEAGRALGLTRHLIMRLITVPVAMRSMLPALTNQYLHLIRNTSLGAAIAFPEVTHVMAGTVLNQTGQAFETIGLTMGVYLGISILASLLIERFNRHLITQGARRTGT